MRQLRLLGICRQTKHTSRATCSSAVYGALLLFGLFGSLIYNNPALGIDTMFDWKEVPVPSNVSTLKMLANQCKANYESIKTWQGTCDVEMQERLSEKFVAGTFQNSVNRVRPLSKRSIFTSQFAIDFASNSIYRLKKTSKTIFADDNGKEVKMLGVRPVDESTIITSEHYLHMIPNQIWPGFKVLPDFPQARYKRAAFRDPTQEANGQNFGDLIDPRDFFTFGGGDITFGRTLEGYVHRLQSNGPSDLNISVFESTMEGGRLTTARSHHFSWGQAKSISSSCGSRRSVTTPLV